MIAAIVALIFYVVDPMLGVIMALILPSIVAMDTEGNYAEALLVVFFAVALFFVRKAAFMEKED